MAKKSRGQRNGLKLTVPKTGSCTNCRTPDVKAADGKWCNKRRIELDPSEPVLDCPYWRKPLPL